MDTKDNIMLIAPCGMNCGICMAFLRKKNKCAGCRGSDEKKPVTRTNCKIKTCDTIKKSSVQFCFACADFPCENLKKLDKRYRNKYNMSMIENLKNINKNGIEAVT